jgi:hypothetical protein
MVPVLVCEYGQLPYRRTGKFEAEDRNSMIERLRVRGHGEENRASHETPVLEVRGEALCRVENGSVIANVSKESGLEHGEKFSADAPGSDTSLAQSRPAERALVLPQRVATRTDEGADLFGRTDGQLLAECRFMQELLRAGKIIEFCPETCCVKFIDGW